MNLAKLENDSHALKLIKNKKMSLQHWCPAQQIQIGQNHHIFKYLLVYIIKFMCTKFYVMWHYFHRKKFKRKVKPFEGVTDGRTDRKSMYVPKPSWRDIINY